MGAEQPLHPRGFPLAAFLGQKFLQLHRPLGAVLGLHHIIDAQPIRLPLLLSAVGAVQDRTGHLPCLPRRSAVRGAAARNGQNLQPHIEQDAALQILHRMPGRDMAKLMPQHRGKLSLVFQGNQQPPGDGDIAAGHGKGIGAGVVDDLKGIGQIGPMADLGQPHPYGGEVLLEVLVMVFPLHPLDRLGKGLFPKGDFFLFTHAVKSQLRLAGNGIHRTAAEQEYQRGQHKGKRPEANIHDEHLSGCS